MVSKLAKEKQIENSGRSKLNQLEESKQRVKQLIQAEEEEYESHFVENPFIRMRERALQRQLDSRGNLGAAQLRMASATGAADVNMMDMDDAERQDIVIVKETGKFIINDLEMPNI